MLASQTSTKTHWDNFHGVIIKSTERDGVIAAIAHGRVGHNHIFELQSGDCKHLFKERLDEMLPNLADVRVTLVHGVNALSNGSRGWVVR